MPLLPVIWWISSSALATAAIVFGWDAAQSAGKAAGLEAGKQIASTERTVGSGLNMILLLGVGLASYFLVSEVLKHE